ncbi:MAG TPA: phytanoyl-CoA dioxygenase family protein [Planctomycetota bacterium]|nr:phytanoyl-CoA dioxygenase family protein [Planctomycetota bacterium]
MIEDLSTRHEPVSEIFPRFDPAEVDRYRLSPEALEHYEEYGYFAPVRILSEEQVDILRDELAALVDPSHPGHHLFYEYHSNESSVPGTVLFHALGHWRITPGFHDALWNPAFTVPASQLLGGAVRFWHDQLFFKPVRDGGVVAWHQDYSYWTRTQPLAHLTCWIGLDDSTVDNGCLHYVPGSHRWELLPVTGLAGDMNAILTVLDDEQKRAFQPVAIELKKGEASFHHPLLVHGSYENRTDRPRRAMVLNVCRDGVRSASDEPLLAGVPPIPKGEKLGGQYFPLLFQGLEAN